MNDVWFCEECGEEQHTNPRFVEKYAGDVELWFCEECVNEGHL